MAVSNSGGQKRPILVQTTPGAPEYEEESDGLSEILRNAPAWLVSSVFHMTLLIVLGLIAVGTQLHSSDVAIAVAPEENQLEGTQLDDPSVLQGDSPHVEGKGPEEMITPRDLPPVEDPLASPIALGDLKAGVGDVGLSPFTGPTTIAGAPIGMALRGRHIGSRNVLLGRYGGTAETEKAVESGLAWLAKQQRSDGTWSLSGPYADAAGHGDNAAAATAMALLAFQGHGDTHRDGKYAKVVARGWSALLKMQDKDGLFTSSLPEYNHLLYTHAQSTIALCELYGMTGDSRYRVPAERAIEYCVAAQDPKLGGWRYRPREDSDTSVTGWFVMALQSARMAGLQVPQKTLDRVSDYLNSAQIDGGRRYGYWINSNPTKAVTAEGLLCRQYLGWAQDDPRLVEGATALNLTPIKFNGDLNHDVYYWYYATQVTHHMEGKIWEKWNNVMRKEMPANQTKSGPEAGSWNPKGDRWGSDYGRLYMTCLSLYILEVYYRHLPIYSGYSAITATNAKSQAPPADDAVPPKEPAVGVEPSKEPADGAEAPKGLPPEAAKALEAPAAAAIDAATARPQPPNGK